MASQNKSTSTLLRTYTSCTNDASFMAIPGPERHSCGVRPGARDRELSLSLRLTGFMRYELETGRSTLHDRPRERSRWRQASDVDLDITIGEQDIKS